MILNTSAHDRSAGHLDNLNVLAPEPSHMTDHQMKNELPNSTEVLIAGGGPVGLAAAVELGRRGIDCVVVEPRREVSRARPRCKTINPRTMEHLRRWGISDELRNRSPLPASWSQDIVFCTSLVGLELARFHGVFGLSAQDDRFPELGQQAPQYVFEELLREVTEDLPSVVLATGFRATDVTQDAQHAQTTVSDAGGREFTILSEYLIGCDGPGSVIRACIGSRYEGEQSAKKPNVNMVFRAPGLLERVSNGPAVQYWVANGEAPAVIGPLDREGTWWTTAFGLDPDTDDDRKREFIDTAAGIPTGCEILSVDPWTVRMQIVDRARVGRVFLAGDAAHLNPPFGGHGMNTGVGDGVDVGWKVAAALRGCGGPRLLDSYQAERRVIQSRVIRAASSNSRTMPMDLVQEGMDALTQDGQALRDSVRSRIQAEKRAEFHSMSLVLDLSTPDSPVIAGHKPVADVADDDVPLLAARPGARLPHVWLDPESSLYDQLGPEMTLVCFGSGHQGDAERLRVAAGDRGIPITILDLGDRELSARYEAELALVRPDYQVAWCGNRIPEDEVAALLDVVCGFESRAVLGLS